MGGPKYELDDQEEDLMYKLAPNFGLRRRLLSVFAGCAVVSTTLVWAQAYPHKPVTLVVPFPPGGSADAGARIVSQALAEQLDVTIVVDNKPGANANIGSGIVARAAGDGYTLLYNTSSITLSPSLYKELPYDFQEDLAAVGPTLVVPLALVVPASLPVRDIKEFLAYAKNNQQALSYGSAGNGNITHLSAFQLARETGFSAMHVPYKGSGPANLDLIAGRLDFMTDTLNNVLPFHRNGSLRILAVTTQQRMSLLPDVPTFAEAGIPDVGSGAWSGLMVPASTPPEIIARLSEGLQQALMTASVQERIAQLGAEPLLGSPAEYGAFLKAEFARWADVIKSTGMTVE